MNSLAAWVFDDPTPHVTADGRHTFYRVIGRPARPDVFLAWGIIERDVTGEAATPDEALAEAMKRAVRVMDEATQRNFEISAAKLRGGLW